MKRIYKLLLSITSGFILSLGWYEWGSGLFLLIGLLALMFVEENITNNTKRSGNQVYLYASLSFFVWNLIDTWWIKNASFAGMIAAIFISTLFMSIPFWLYSVTKKQWGRYIGYSSLIIYWIAFEFAYMHGEISWPWLTLGNGFLYEVKLVQWYEYTGVFGGSAWILLMNILIFEIIRRLITGVAVKLSGLLVISTILLLILPVAFSLIRYHSYKEIANPREIVVVQPNIDPYLKFVDMPQIEQTMIQLTEAARLTTESTDYVVAPETSISGRYWIDRLERVNDIQMIREFQTSFPKLKYVVGIYCYERYNSIIETTRTARPMGKTGYYYDTHNSAIQLDSTGYIPIYHKSMLVTGVEKMPYTWLMKPIEKLTLHLGGIFRSHGIQEDREVFEASDDNVKIAPVICYESIFGEFVGDYIKKGANVIFVITNDGWWGDTPGYRQHNALSCLRAIETRRSIARSANTGISCFINQRGDVLQKLGWWKRGAIRDHLNLNEKITFYVKHGDYLGRMLFFMAIVLLLALTIKKILNFRQNRT